MSGNSSSRKGVSFIGTHDETLAAAELRQKARDWLAKSAVNGIRADPGSD